MKTISYSRHKSRLASSSAAIAAAGISLLPHMVRAQVTVFDAINRTVNNTAVNPFNGTGTNLDSAGTSTRGGTTLANGRTLLGQSFNASSTGITTSGFQLNRLDFYVYNEAGGTSASSFTNIRATISLFQYSNAEDSNDFSGKSVFNPVSTATSFTFNLTNADVASINAGQGKDGFGKYALASVGRGDTNGSGELSDRVSLALLNTAGASNNGFGDATDDTNTTNNRNHTFLGISIKLAGSINNGTSFAATNDLSVAIWDKGNYDQTATGKIAMSTANRVGGFYRDSDDRTSTSNTTSPDTLHSLGNFTGQDERSVANTTFDSLAIRILGQNIQSMAVPEPSTAALALPFLVTGGSLLWKRSRRSRKAPQAA